MGTTDTKVLAEVQFQEIVISILFKSMLVIDIISYNTAEIFESVSADYM